MNFMIGLRRSLKLERMINYLYYKMYQATLKSSLKDIPLMIAPAFLGTLLSVNVIVVSALLAKLDVFPFVFSNSKQGGIFTFLVMIFIGSYYYWNERYKRVLLKYSTETNKKRILGNILISIYVALSFISIFFIAFFRPGYLPSL
jgi:uncharacterized membrane protein